MAENMPKLKTELCQIGRRARLSSAVDDLDKIIDRIAQVRDEIASGQDPHAASLLLMKLQNPVKEGFEAVNNDLKAVSKAQREFGKVLDKSFPVTTLPTDYDTMKKYPALVNRAIAMHFLREGQFHVASVFMDEARAAAASAESSESPDDDDDNTTMTNTGGNSARDADAQTIANFTEDESVKLQEKFQGMYAVLQAIKARELGPAIQWARQNSAALESRGSNLEFELCRLQFVWLAKTAGHALPDQDHDDCSLPTLAVNESLAPAFHYAQNNFSRFSERHLSEIQRLAAALVYRSNIRESPYATVFETASAFDEVATAFTREFCFLLGLSAESPLYLATTAGAVALPRLIKFIGATRSKHTEWTSTDELPFETPLPESMIYHTIFVCPVSKEQTTEDNPPMRLPCGHVLARDSLQNLAKNDRFKCPYCPMEGYMRDARQIIL